MIPITQLQPGDDFYFENDRATIFTFVSFVHYKSGEIKSAKCCETGKLHPHYFSWRAMVIKLKK